MAGADQQSQSLARNVAWPLLVLTAALQVYLGLSAFAYGFMGVPAASGGFARWVAAILGGGQAIAAIWACVLANRRDLRAVTLAVAASVLLGWLSSVPSALGQGLDFRGADTVTPVFFVLSPIVTIIAAVLAWRHIYPVTAALLVSATTILGIFIVIFLSVVIALYGF